MNQAALQLPSSPSPAAAASAVLVNVVVLSGDRPLYEAIRYAVGDRNPVWRARSAEETVELLVTGRCGVLLIDMGAVSTAPATLIEQVVEQFPDVVVIVAGRCEDEAVLARLISEGLVYRFMHKPLSPRRAGMFLNAAIRAHVERRDGRAADTLLPLVAELRTRRDVRKWLFVGFGLALFIVAVAAALVLQFGLPPAPPQRTATAQGLAPSPTAPAPLADPVLSRARAAYDAGRYEAPPGRNALDLFEAVLLARPGDAEARSGLDATMARILELAERKAGAGNRDEASRLAERVLAVRGDHAEARALLVRLRPPAPQPAPRAAVTPPPDARTPAVAPNPVQRPVPERVATPVPVVRQAPLPEPVHRFAPAPAPPVTRTRVQPDPLTPRVVNADAVPPSRPVRAAGSGGSEGARVAPALPIAGYERSAPQQFSPGMTAEARSLPDRDLVPVATPEPTYPADALRGGVEGWVEVDFTVTERGATRDIQVVGAEPHGVFDAAATQAVAAWRYQPRVANGRPVPQRTSVTLHFNVDD